MSMRRWDPLSDLLGLQEKMNRLFEESLASVRQEPPGGPFTPPADAYETGDAYVVEVDLPGVCEGELGVQASERTLSVRGERRPEEISRPDRFLRMERSFGPFARSFSFPEPVDTDRVQAHLRDGLLQVTLPKVRPPRRGLGQG